MKHRSILAALFLFTALVLAPGLSRSAPVSGSGDIPPGAPADVRKILLKVKAGKMPTAAEIARLQQWSRQISAKVNDPTTNGSQFAGHNGHVPNQQKGIPCDIHVTIHWQGQFANSHEQGSVDILGKAVLFPDLKGAGDFFASVPDPSVPVSSFRFEPYAPGGKLASTGSGTASYDDYQPAGSFHERVRFTSATCGFLLVTTGRGDDLYPAGGGVDGLGEGTDTTVSSSTSSTEAYKNNSKHWDQLQIPFAQEILDHPSAGQPTPKPTAHLSYRALVEAVRSAGTKAVIGSEAFDFTRSNTHYTGSSTVTITLRPAPLDLVIEPTDLATYQQWLPNPDPNEPGIDGRFDKAKNLSVHVALVDPTKGAAAGNGKTVPNAQQGGHIDLYLRDVSEHQGICMNYPPSGDTKSDLFFAPKQPDGIEYIDEKHVATTSNTAVEATVLVSSRDTGAYGKVQAEIPSLGLVSKDLRTGAPSLAVPIDDDQNHIADGWEKQYGVYGKPAEWDEEDTPAGMKSKGDGYTLFDEYRGFLLEDPSGSEKFKRLDPRHRKLLVYLDPKDKDLHRQGCQRYQAITGIETLYVHDPARLGMFSAGDPVPRWANFDMTPHSTKQAAVWIYDDDPAASEGNPPGTTFPPNADSKSPNTAQRVRISHNAARFVARSFSRFIPPRAPGDGEQVPPDWQSTAATLGLNLSDIGNSYPQRLEALTNELIVSTTVHELGHATGASHHNLAAVLAGTAKDPDAYGEGDAACPMRYWHFAKDPTEKLLYMSGRWKLDTAASGNPLKFCAECWPKMHLK